MEMHLPDGVSLEELERYAAEKERKRRRDYNAAHPETVMRQRITAAENLLRRNGFLVLKGELPPFPWDELQQKAILRALQTNQEDARHE